MSNREKVYATLIGLWAVGVLAYMLLSESHKWPEMTTPAFAVVLVVTALLFDRLRAARKARQSSRQR